MSILDVLFTKHCLACGETIKLFGSRHFCDECQKTVESTKEYADVISTVEHVKSIFLYKGSVRLALLRMKHKKDRRIRAFFADELSEAIKTDMVFDEVTTVVCVPRYQRSFEVYNQSKYLAMRIAKNINKPFHPNILYKKRDNKSQTKCENKAERKKNVIKVFGVNKKVIKGKYKKFIPETETVLIIDDIITTGATMNACAEELLKAGVRKVYGAVVAFTPNNRTEEEPVFERTMPEYTEKVVFENITVPSTAIIKRIIHRKKHKQMLNNVFKYIE